MSRFGLLLLLGLLGGLAAAPQARAAEPFAVTDVRTKRGAARLLVGVEDVGPDVA